MTSRRICLSVWALAVLLPAAPSPAADWPQWRGLHRNGISAESGWAPNSNPRRVWSAQVGEGFSSVAVAGGRVYTMGNSGGKDWIHCLNAATGKPVWQYTFPASSGDYGGPRATPTVSGGKVYTLNRHGQAHCINAATGKLVWQADVARLLSAERPTWGFAGSPLILGSLALYNVGTAGAALNKETGRLVWGSGPKTAGYSSPVLFSAAGKRGVALFVAWGIVAVNPDDGKPLWQFPWDTRHDVNAADPQFAGDSVFISSNYGRGAALLRLGKGNPSVAWENRNMKNHFNTSVLLNGYLYGNDENTLKCIELKSGDERWRLRGIGKGGLIAANGKLIILSERGELIFANASPAGYKELARANVMRGTCWTHPVLADGFIYCRSQEGELVCVDVRAR